MESFLIFKDLAIVVFAAKLMGLLAKKLKAPQVVRSLNRRMFWNVRAMQ